VLLVLALAYRPDGAEIAVATLGGSLFFVDVQSEEVTRSIEGHHDIGNTRAETDKITAKKASEGK
jgi:periodic tryptophan protein 2